MVRLKQNEVVRPHVNIYTFWILCKISGNSITIYYYSSHTTQMAMLV